MTSESGASYSLEVQESIHHIDSREWNSCHSGNPFLKHCFLSALEDTGCASPETGWQPLHLKLTDTSGQICGFMPLYLKSHSQGEYVFDHGWAQAYERAGGHYYPKLQCSVPFSPVVSSKLLVNPNRKNPDHIREHLLIAAQDACSKLGVSSLHLTFLPPEERLAAKNANYLLRSDQQFHWRNANYANFDGFLEALSSRKRKQIRKERKTATENGISIQRVEGADITPDMWDAFYNFYMDTGSRKWGHPYLNRAFFEEIAHKMPENIMLILCEYENRYIAGALNFKGPDTLYGRYWGCVEDHPCLHFEACYYQAIEYAIANNFSVIEAGAQGPHKLARGYEPVETVSAHWIKDTGLRDAIENFLRHERHHVGTEIEYLADRTPFKKG